MASGEVVGKIWVSRWSDLSHDLLDSIVKKLACPSDYIRFRSVCKSWRSVAKPSNLPPGLPLLMLPYDPSSHLRSVFSLSTNQVRTLSIPALVNKVILTAARGWLLVLDVAPAHGRLFLFNPVTGAEIPLPPTNGFFHREPGLFCSPVHHKFLGSMRGIRSAVDLSPYWGVFPWRAFLLSSPDSARRDCMVVIGDCYPRDFNVAFCKLGDESWTALHTGLDHLPVSVVHHEGSLYVIDTEGDASVCNFSAPWKPERMDLPEIDTEYYYKHLFFVTTSTQLLLFSRYVVRVVPDDGDEDYKQDFKKCFAIFELKPGNPPAWSRVDSIRDNAVFRSLPLYQNFSLCSRDIRGFRENCIYAGKPYDFYGPERDAHEIDVLDLKTGDYEHLSCDSAERRPEKLLHPVWVELSLCKIMEQGPVRHHRFTLEDPSSGDTVEGDACMALCDRELAFIERSLLEKSLMMVDEEGEGGEVENGDNH